MRSRCSTKRAACSVPPAAGRVQPLLRGKNLGLLCADDTQPQALLFRQAASELGAHVAHIGMSLSEASDPQEVAHTARMLGRLYDAVECQGLDSALVQQIADVAGIAVYDGLASDERLTSRLAAQLGNEAAPRRTGASCCRPCSCTPSSSRCGGRALDQDALRRELEE